MVNLRRENAELKKVVAEQAEVILALRARIAQLEKTSRNSSKPPSSDIVKPQPGGKESKRKIGAQPGHQAQQRVPFPAEKVDEVVEYELATCPDCGHSLQATDEPPKILQQIEFVEKPYIITEHKTYTYWCEHCQTYHQSQLPPEVKNGGLFGKQLLAHTAYMKGQLHTSYRLLKKYFHDIFGLDVSTGYLTKQIRKVSKVLLKA